METIKKFVVVGPETTGKITLCSQLATHYHTAWVPEYAREFLEKNGMDYTYDDLLTIAKKQVELEDSVRHQLHGKKAGLPQQAPGAPGRVPFFIDTDMYVMKVWCEFVFNKC